MVDTVVSGDISESNAEDLKLAESNVKFTLNSKQYKDSQKNITDGFKFYEGDHFTKAEEAAGLYENTKIIYKRYIGFGIFNLDRFLQHYGGGRLA